MSTILLKRIAELEYLNSELLKSLAAVHTMHENVVATTANLQNFVVGRFAAR